MRKRPDLAASVIPPLLCLLLAATSVSAAEGGSVEVPTEPDPQLSVDAASVPAEYDRQVEVLEQKGGALGYSFLSSDGHAGHAMEYGFLESSRSGGLFYRHMEKDSNLELDGFYLNEHDYRGTLLLDYRGDYRLNLGTESLYHNLDHETLFSPDFQTGRSDAPTLADYRAIQDPMRSYGVSVVQDRADFRYRLHNYPMHLNLGYWSFLKEGTIQQRFADASFEGPLNTVRAEARAVDQQVRQGRIGLDAHLGPVDVIYDFTVRSFEDKLPTPVANYEARNDIHGLPEQLGGLQQHNDNPDSRFMSHTVKVHSSIDGGLVAGASYSLARRENLSRLSAVTGARHAKVYLQNAAGDFVYTPDREYTFSLKFRRQEQDQSRAPLFSTNFADPAQVVKPPLETTKNIVIATAAYKPRLDLSLVGEYRGEFLRRHNNISDLPSPTTWALPESTATHTGTLAVYYRPVKGLRSSGHYTYSKTDNPSYGSQAKERHEGKLIGTYTRSNRWGLTAHVVLRHEDNNEVERFLINFPFDPLVYTPYPNTSRHKRSENSSVGVWYVPLPKLTVGGNYSYLRTKIDQDVLFTTVFDGSEAASRYVSRSHVYGVNGSYSFNEKCDLSLSLQQIRSDSSFQPEAVTFTIIPGSTAGIQQISETDNTHTTFSARGEYRFNSVLSTSLEFAVRDYDEKKVAQSAYSGTAHAVLALVAAKW